MTADDTTALIERLVSNATMDRFPRWSSTIAFRVAGEPWVVCTTGPEGLTCARWTDATPLPQTIVEATSAGVSRWLRHGVDFTHLVKSGDLTVTTGSYFDLLLLSKALRLRPDIDALA